MPLTGEGDGLDRNLKLVLEVGREHLGLSRLARAVETLEHYEQTALNHLHRI